MKKNILYILHQLIDPNNYDSTSIGGTSLHLLDIIERVKKDYNCFVLYSFNGRYSLAVYTENEMHVMDLDVKVHDVLFSSYNKEYKKMLSELIDKLHINLVHIHHLQGHAYDLVDVLKEKNLKPVITLHDYFMICPRINMLYKNKEYCDLKDCKQCDECLTEKIDIKKRNKKIEELFTYSQSVIVPNKTVKDIYSRIHPKANYQVIEHGSNTPVNTIVRKRHNLKKLNVAFVGFLPYLKGSDIAKALLKKAKKSEYKFHLFGLSDDPFFSQNTRNYIFHGEYKREELSKLLNKNKIDVVCLLTRCPETYCYTLSEVINAKMPIIGFDIGAIGERIERLKVGWISPLEQKEDGILELLQKIKKDNNMYEQVLYNLNQTKLPSVEEMVSDTLKEYTILKDTKIVDFDMDIFKHFDLRIEEISLRKKKIGKKSKIYSYLKRYIPYSIKRPIYLLIRKIRDWVRL